MVGAGQALADWPGPVPVAPYTDSPTLELCTVGLPLDSELPALVRPYVVAHEERQHQRHATRPRVKLILAPHGMVVIP
ncbi:hypothetical protein [Streptomyces cucumeris]|uniref:hypothetical protein n=1 Tax=Streptomyces cucumeris TaxID=2962890 RepID=UPI003D7554FE